MTKVYWLYGIINQDVNELYSFIQVITGSNEMAMKQALFLQNNKIYWDVHVREFSLQDVQGKVPPKFEQDIPLTVRNVIYG